ncbi:hypothetical protein PAXRUDRAFT_425941 [Paxillus rubicundulus Ve08.2h10]|uniref:Uncharacterized protein n=1 Tax=Paxillus rubicundulus Ve08.2h10 TaxID=930991 RepID=A0A0D0D868_9AGAM|nr:hypothetical protein PAXRUDRAFT_425941 [Paxillus rubicundulus Ve08.2h10]
MSSNYVPEVNATLKASVNPLSLGFCADEDCRAQPNILPVSKVPCKGDTPSKFGSARQLRTFMINLAFELSVALKVIGNELEYNEE